MATRFTPTSTARRPLVALAALLAATAFAASLPVPVLGPEAGRACPAGSGNCGG